MYGILKENWCNLKKSENAVVTYRISTNFHCIKQTLAVSMGENPEKTFTNIDYSNNFNGMVHDAF